MKMATPPIPTGLCEFLATKGLTPRQHDAACAFYRLHAADGYAPSLQEWSDAIGISKVALLDHVAALITKDVITRGTKHKARSHRPIWRPPAKDIAARCERYRAALVHYSEMAVGGEVARDALEATT